MKQKRGVIISGGTIERDFALAFLQEYAGQTARCIGSGSAGAEECDEHSGPGNQERSAGVAEAKGCGAYSGADDQAQGAEIGERAYEIIAADRGLVFCLENGIRVDAVVGDFDSADRAVLKELDQMPGVEIRIFQPEKDWTDTELAVDLAIERGWTEAVLLGGTGTRLDHVLGTLQVMELALGRGLSLIILDSHNKVWMVDRSFEIRKTQQSGQYVSLIPWGGPVKDLTLRGFHYETDGIELITGASRGISNEIDAPVAQAVFSEGKLIVVESRD